MRIKKILFKMLLFLLSEYFKSKNEFFFIKLETKLVY